MAYVAMDTPRGIVGDLLTMIRDRLPQDADRMRRTAAIGRPLAAIDGQGRHGDYLRVDRFLAAFFLAGAASRFGP